MLEELANMNQDDKIFKLFLDFTYNKKGELRSHVALHLTLEQFT